MALGTTLRSPTWLGRQMLQAELTPMRAFSPLFVAFSLMVIVGYRFRGRNGRGG